MGNGVNFGSLLNFSRIPEVILSLSGLCVWVFLGANELLAVLTGGIGNLVLFCWKQARVYFVLLLLVHNPRDGVSRETVLTL